MPRPPTYRESSKIASSLGVLANTSRIIHNLETTIDKAEAKFRSKAFLHWYEQEGCSRGDIALALEGIEEIIYTYIEASSKIGESSAAL